MDAPEDMTQSHNADADANADVDVMRAMRCVLMQELVQGLC